MLRWTGKVVLVTGGSAGLGRAIAAAFADAGASVLIAAREQHRIDQTCEALCAAGHSVLGKQTDVTSESDVTALIDYVVATFGRLDVLVNCAGRSSRGLLADTSTQEFASLLELNFLSAVRCTRAALPALLKARGHVVNICSLSAKTASPYLGAYAASKFPLVAYSQQLRLEYAAAGLHSLLVCPGPIRRKVARLYPLEGMENIPRRAREPGAGVHLQPILAEKVARGILHACQHRQAELIIPGRARFLFALAQIWPKLGDWIVRWQSG
jgi:NAD(P)-dependent dehydrogenase (short-subunit alcohol dehydrogenase family)